MALRMTLKQEILNVFVDDGESIIQVIESLRYSGKPLNRKFIKRVLIQLLEEKLIKIVYLYQSKDADFTNSENDSEENYWFEMTEAGRREWEKIDDKKALLLTDILPDITNVMKSRFRAINRNDLLQQVDYLTIYSLCECGDRNCGSFYTIDPPDENIEHDVEGVSLNIKDFRIMVEIYDGLITFIDIMPSQYGYEIRSKIKDLVG